jgi:hypothetical protein
MLPNICNMQKPLVIDLLIVSRGYASPFLPIWWFSTIPWRIDSMTLK